MMYQFRMSLTAAVAWDVWIKSGESLKDFEDYDLNTEYWESCY